MFFFSFFCFLLLLVFFQPHTKSLTVVMQPNRHLTLTKQHPPRTTKLNGIANKPFPTPPNPQPNSPPTELNPNPTSLPFDDSLFSLPFLPQSIKPSNKTQSSMGFTLGLGFSSFHLILGAVGWLVPFTKNLLFRFYKKTLEPSQFRLHT